MLFLFRRDKRVWRHATRYSIYRQLLRFRSTFFAQRLRRLQGTRHRFTALTPGFRLTTASLRHGGRNPAGLLPGAQQRLHPPNLPLLNTQFLLQLFDPQRLALLTSLMCRSFTGPDQPLQCPLLDLIITGKSHLQNLRRFRRVQFPR